MDGPDAVQQAQNFQAQVSQLGLLRTFRLTTTGAPQVLNAGVRVGTYWVGNATDYVSLRTISVATDATGRIEFQANLAGVEVDIIVLF